MAIGLDKAQITAAIILNGLTQKKENKLPSQRTQSLQAQNSIASDFTHTAFFFNELKDDADREIKRYLHFDNWDPALQA